MAHISFPFSMFKKYTWGVITIKIQLKVVKTKKENLLVPKPGKSRLSLISSVAGQRSYNIIITALCLHVLGYSPQSPDFIPS